MPLESGTTISQLDGSWPLEGDDVNEGNDHLWLIKNILKTQFPGVLGQGFDTPIVAIEQELNYSQGLTSNIQEQLDALDANDDLKAPVGTVMTFYQLTPPNGWTQITTIADAMMIITDDGTGGTTGGTDDATAPDLTHDHTTGGFQLQITHMPPHDHAGRLISYQNNGGASGPSGGPDGGNNFFYDGDTGVRGGGSSHAHGDTGEANPTFAPKYAKMIIAAKD
jgi:hypothetical protein